MANERRSRFKDNVRTSMRKHEETLSSVKKEEDLLEAESAGEGAPVAEEQAPTKEKPSESKPEAKSNEKSAGEGSADKKATSKPKAAKKAAKPAKEEAPKAEIDPFEIGEGKETKSERVNLLLKKSDKEAWTEAAKARGVSFTVFIETVVNSYLGR